MRGILRGMDTEGVEMAKESATYEQVSGQDVYLTSAPGQVHQRILAGARRGGATTAERRREIAAKVSAFRTALCGRVDAKDSLCAALIDSAVALYILVAPRAFYRPTARGRARSSHIRLHRGPTRRLARVGCTQDDNRHSR